MRANVFSVILLKDMFIKRNTTAEFLRNIIKMRPFVDFAVLFMLVANVAPMKGKN